MARHSKMNDVIGEALGVFGAKGALREEVFSLIHDDMYGDNETSKRKSLSNGLTRAMNADLIVTVAGRWYLKEYDPSHHRNGHQNGSAPKVQVVALYANKRSGKSISIYKSPLVFTDAIALSFLMDGKWWKIPLFSSIRVCIGQETPLWSPEQETYRNVEIVRVTHKNGLTTDERPAPTDTITIASVE